MVNCDSGDNKVLICFVTSEFEMPHLKKKSQDQFDSRLCSIKCHYLFHHISIITLLISEAEAAAGCGRLMLLPCNTWWACYDMTSSSSHVDMQFKSLCEVTCLLTAILKRTKVL